MYDPIGHRAMLDEKAFAVGRVVDILLALGAHLSGDYVADVIARNRPEDVRVIEATVPASVIRKAASVLALASGIDVVLLTPPDTGISDDATVASATRDRNDTGTGCTRLVATIAHGGETVVAATIEMRPHFYSCEGAAIDGVFSHSTTSIAFDRQILALSSDKLYRRLSSASGAAGSCSVHALLERARHKRFCLVRSFCRVILPAHHARTMRAAASLVSASGWTMDDLMAGREAWVASKWRGMSECRRFHPKSHLRQPQDDPRVHDECPICQDKFGAEDVVINLPCNHNFHASCTPPSYETGYGGSGGICEWLDAGFRSQSRSHAACPCCRVSVYSSAEGSSNPPEAGQRILPRR